MPDDPADDFLSAALAIAEGKEDNAEVRQLLTTELTQATAEASPETLRAAPPLLRTGGSPRIRRIAAILAILIALICMTLNAWPFYVYRSALAQLFASWTGDFSLLMSLANPSEIPGVPHPSANQHLLLLGREGAYDKPDRFRGLADSDPGNASYYAVYIRVLAAGEAPMPPDFIARVQETDPGNGELFLTAMASDASRAVELNIAAGTYSIRDQAAFEQALHYLHLAAAAPVLRSRVGEIWGERRRALPQPDDYLSINAQGFLSTQDSYLRLNLPTASLFLAATQKYSAEQDAGSFLRLSKDWRAVIRKLTMQPSSKIDLLVFRAILSQTSAAFAKAARDLHLNDESIYYSQLSFELQNLTFEINDAHRQAEAAYSYSAGDSLLPGSASFLIPPGSPGEMAPERLSTHAFLHRITIFILCGSVLLLTTAAAAYRFRASAVSQRLAEILYRLNRKRTVPIAIAASLTPLLLSQIHAWSPIGATQWNVFWGGLILMNLQTLSAVALALLLPLQVVRLALRRPATTWLSPGPGALTLWSGWAASACAAGAWILSAFIPGREGFEALFNHNFQLLSGVAPPEFTGASAIFLWIACGLLAAAFVWLALFAGRALLSSRKALPQRLATARLVLPSLLAVLCCLALMQPALHTLEKAYVRSDALATPDRDNPSITTGEARVVIPTWLRLKEILQKVDKL